MSRRLNVAHLAAHVGGGVGSVLRDFVQSAPAASADHHLICFDTCIENYDKMKGLSSKRDRQLPLDTRLRNHLRNAFDVVLIHFWNHPLTALFLSYGIQDLRLVIWSHNSGLSEPNVIPHYLVSGNGSMYFSSSCSLTAPNLISAFYRYPYEFKVIHSTCSLDEFLRIGISRSKRALTQRLLYVGTVSDAKMHPQAAEIFARLSRAGCEVVVVGGPLEANLDQRVTKLGGVCRVTGYIDDPLPYLRDGDVFVYPLRRGHYGTGEQVILEAMAAGLPVVAFNNPAEAAIVEHGVSGFLATSNDEFCRYVEVLVCNENLYRSLSSGAITAVCNRFDSRSMAMDLMNVIEEAATRPGWTIPAQIKSNSFDYGMATFALNSFFDPMSIRGAIDGDANAAEIVFEKIRPALCRLEDRGIWMADTKSSPFHYLSYFPESPGLRTLCEMIRDFTAAD